MDLSHNKTKKSCSVRQSKAKQNKAKKAAKQCRARHARQEDHSTAKPIVESKAHSYTSKRLPTLIHRGRKLSAAAAAAGDLSHAEQNIEDSSAEKHTTITMNYDTAPNNHFRFYTKSVQRKQ